MYEDACLLVVFRAIALMMETVSTSETSVNLHQTTRRNNPKVNHLQTRRRENLKSQMYERSVTNSRNSIEQSPP
jgi:hypothetical protein